MSNPPDAPESGSGDLRFVAMTHPPGERGMRQLGGIGETLRKGGLGNEPTFCDTVDLAVVLTETADGTIIEHPAVGDKRYLAKLQTKPFLVEIGIIEVGTIWASTHPNGTSSLAQEVDQPRAYYSKAPTLVVQLSLSEDDSAQSLGMFKTYVDEGGKEASIPEPESFADKRLDNLGVEINLWTGQGKIVAHEADTSEGQIVEGPRFNAGDVGRSLIYKRTESIEGRQPDPDDEFFVATTVDEDVKTATLAVEFVVSVVAAAGAHLARMNRTRASKD